MTIIKEYRITLPMTSEEYRTAQLYMVARFSREMTTKGEGIEILKNEPYENEHGKGQFTHKKIYLGSHLPSWATPFVPSSLVTVEEKAWNAYPYVKIEYTSPGIGERFSIISETRYFDDDGSQQNVHNLTADQLLLREVDNVDIVSEEVDPKYYKKEEDPKLYTSEKTKRGPLQPGWQKTTKPLMCIYKLATVTFNCWPASSWIEAYIQKSMVRDVLLLGHKQAFTWMDEWLGMEMDDLRKYEAETKVILDKLRTGVEQQKTDLQVAQ